MQPSVEVGRYWRLRSGGKDTMLEIGSRMAGVRNIHVGVRVCKDKVNV
jgi:hypothetical protein